MGNKSAPISAMTRDRISRFLGALESGRDFLPHAVKGALRRARPTTAGFTLVELLVVIAIVGILVAMLVPALGRMRNAALTTASLSNLRQIHVLMQNYLNQNSCVYPPAVSSSSIFPDQGGNVVYWRRAIWEASYPSSGFWDPNFPSAAYNKAMWCPLMKSKYGSCSFKEGHGSYAMHKYFHYWEWPPGDTTRTRNSLNMQGMGKRVPYIFAGNAATDTPAIGTYCYAESSAYPYDTRWYNLAYEYGAKGNMALGLFLDGSIRLIDQTNGVQMNALFSQQTNLP